MSLEVMSNENKYSFSVHIRLGQSLPLDSVLKNCTRFLEGTRRGKYF